MRQFHLSNLALIMACICILSCSKQQEFQKSNTETKPVRKESSESGGKTKAIEFTEKEKEIMDLAKKEFVKHGRKVEDYKMSLEFDNTEKKWFVWFEYKSERPIPGGTDCVTIEEDTGKVVFFAGK